MDNTCTVRITGRKHANALNSMESNYYRYVTGRIRNADGTHYRQFKFVVCVDADDIWASLDNQDADDYTEADVTGCLNEAETAMLESINSWADVKEFYSLCQDSLNRHYSNFKHEYEWAKALKWLHSAH